MERPVKGDVVVLPFPFSDLSGKKHRPAFVIADLPGNDVIVCQITSKHKSDPLAVAFDQSGFASGSLPQDGFIRPNYIFTADKNIILFIAGHLSEAKSNEVITVLLNIISP